MIYYFIQLFNHIIENKSYKRTSLSYSLSKGKIKNNSPFPINDTFQT